MTPRYQLCWLSILNSDDYREEIRKKGRGQSFLNHFNNDPIEPFFVMCGNYHTKEMNFLLDIFSKKDAMAAFYHKTSIASIP